jgi:hypothetical protein
MHSYYRDFASSCMELRDTLARQLQCRYWLGTDPWERDPGFSFHTYFVPFVFYAPYLEIIGESTPLVPRNKYGIDVRRISGVGAGRLWHEVEIKLPRTT